MLDNSQSVGSPQVKRGRSSLGRRGALGALAALVGATLGKVTEQSAHAQAAGDVVLGATNTTGGNTTVVNTSQSGIGFSGRADLGIGVAGSGGSYGLYGAASGAGNGFGIFGFSPSGFGIVAQSTNAVGLYAVSSTNIGGYAISTSNIGMIASSTSNVGVLGSSGSNIGVNATSATGVALRASGPTELYGNVEIGDFETPGAPLYNLNITGDLRVNGQKSAIVRGADGDYRQFYCVESPESFFEDLGMATLDRGKVTVSLENEFKQFVAPKRGFYVFLTPLADTPGLYVSKLGDDSFEVREVGNGQSNIQFQYRVVCTRKDVPGKRLERVDPTKLSPGRRRVPRTEVQIPTPPPMPPPPRGTGRPGEVVPAPPPPPPTIP